ncbi:MAG: peptidoglycan-binding protein [Hyphomonas sp.]|uniref:peptidoglycan-binding protein n=1 Tax=Hyphomonas sp. TaxID=87 RepID=UPI003527A46D
MSQTRPWSVKGIDERAREAAREAATAEGLTLGEYLNRLLIASDPPQPNEVVEPLHRRKPTATAASDTLDRLTRRIEATEARSTLAITGMDHTILGLVTRLETAEQTSSAIAGHVEGMIDELQETFEALQRKVRRMEEDETPKQNLEALKALEQALGKLASHMYEESDLTQQETQAIKGRVESGFADLSERVESMETRVESTLSEAAKRVERAVEQAELRAEGTAKHLSERMSTLETNVHKRMAGVDRADERLDKVEADVSGALDSMESTLVRIQERLNRAETTTDTALKSLESTFASLDERIETVASKVDPDLADRLRSEFEARFETLMSSVRETVDTARMELAEEIAQAATGQDGTFVSEVKETLGDVQKRLTASEERQARAMETVSSQVSRLGASFDARLRDMEERADEDTHETIRSEIERLGHTVSERIDGLAEDLTQRVSDSEARSASAIEQIGDQVAAATNRLQVRQTESIRAIADKVDEHRKKADARLSDALASVSDRLEQMQSQTSTSLSPVQKAIASLAARLESLEDFTTPPHAQKAAHDSLPPVSGLPSNPPLFDAHADEDDGDDALLDAFDDLDIAEKDHPEQEYAVADAEADDDEEFEPGLESWEAADPEPEADASAAEMKDPYRDDFDAIRKAVEKLSFPQSEETLHEYVADLPGGEDDFEDPLGALDGMDDSHTEARESDIFDEDEEFEAFVPPEAEPSTIAAAPAQLDDDTVDYLTRARRAALAASNNKSAAVPEGKTGGKARASQGGGSKLPLLAAASAVAIAGAAVGGYLYMRGKQEAPAQSAPASTYVDPGATAETVAAETAAARPETDAEAAPAEDLETELFGEAAASDEPATGEDALADAELPTEAAQPEKPAEAPKAEAKAEPPAVPAATAPSPKPIAEAPKPVVASATPVAAETATPEPAPAPTAGTPAYAPVPPVVTVEAAAAAGNGIAQYQLGQDRLAAGDLASGADYIRKAAQKGLPIAQYSLAKLHEKGTGVPKDLTLAREWTGKAASAGNVKAMHDLAVFMAEGEGGEQTFAGAVEWFRKGAEFGVVDSQYNLGILYEQGLGISPSMVDALFWFEVAKKNGDGGAPAKVAELAAKVSPEAAAQAKARADEWRAAPANALANGRFGAQPWNTGNPLQVQAIQNALNALGFKAGSADGIMSSATAQAIRNYQSANKLEVTGTVTSELVEQLNKGAVSRS